VLRRLQPQDSRDEAAAFGQRSHQNKKRKPTCLFARIDKWLVLLLPGKEQGPGKAVVFDKNLQQQHRTGPTKLQGP
jgi:hypothetical protein